jgi:phosphocarrier protein
MSSTSATAKVTIQNPQGLHMRPAYLFAETASKFESQVELIKEDVRINGKSVLDILTLGAAQGTEILLEATGDDAHAAIETLEQLVVSGFPTPEKPDAPSETQA